MSRQPRGSGGTGTVFERSYGARAASLVGRHQMADSAVTLVDTLAVGRTLTVADIAADPLLSPEESAAYAWLGIATLCSLPLLQGSRFAANPNVCAGRRGSGPTTPSAWSKRCRPDPAAAERAEPKTPGATLIDTEPTIKAKLAATLAERLRQR